MSGDMSLGPWTPEVLKARARVRNIRVAFIAVFGAVVITTAILIERPAAVGHVIYTSFPSAAATPTLSMTRDDRLVSSTRLPDTTSTVTFATPGAVSPHSTQASRAALAYGFAWLRWLADPNPDTWHVLRTTVVPDQRGVPGEDQPWGPPVLFPIGPSPKAPAGTPFTPVNASVQSVSAAGNSDSTSAIFTIDLLYTLTLNPETAQSALVLLADRVRLRYVSDEGLWLVESSTLLGGRD